jgi:polar amino acid transport system substrate-binding protein
MKNWLPSFLLFLAIFAMLLNGCDTKEVQVTSLQMLKGGKTFAVPTGTAADQYVLKKFPDAKIEYYNSVFDCSMAVRDGKADAVVYDLPVLRNIAAKNEGLKVLDELLVDDQYGFAVRMDDTALKAAMDTVLSEIKSDGTYAAMMTRWFPPSGEPGPMPDIPFTGTNGVLRFGTAAVTEPMSYVDSTKKVIGFDVEYATRIAKKLGKQLEIVNMEFGGMLPALIAGKVDMIGAGLSITEERAKKVLFSKSYYPSGIAAGVKDYGGKPLTEDQTGMKTIGDLKNRRLGVLLGSIHDAYAAKHLPGVAIMQYPNLSDMLFGLNSDKVDAAFFDQSSLKDIFSKNPGLGILAENIITVPIAAGFNKESDQLREQFNLFLKDIRANGIYQEMIDRWMEKGLEEMPEIPGSTENGPLRVGVVSDIGMPSTIVKNGKLIGFDIELASRFAARMGREFVPVDLQFGSLLASVSTGKIDMITSSLMITEERRKQIDFSDPYYASGATVVARLKNIAGKGDKASNQGAGGQDAGESAEKGFLKSVSESFYSNIILEKRYMHIIDGLKVTLLISIFAALFGTLIGALVCLARMSPRKWLSRTASFYIMLLRGTPVLVLLMIIYYVVFASVNINPVVVAVIAFGLNFGAYVSEMFRTAIESIDKGQKEAAIAGGFTRVQTFIYIILPQALRHIFPVYKGEFISMIKMTSIVGYIAVVDLTKASDIIRSRTFDAFFPLLMVALIYLLLAWLLTWLLGLIEISVDPRRKRIEKRGGVRR